MGMEKIKVFTGPIKATCHCGAITVTVPSTPEKAINECQCTICRRYAAAWAYYNSKDVQIDKAEGASTKAYVWGDKQIEFNWCDHCGCMLFWWPILYQEIPKEGMEVGVNSRMMDPEAVKGVTRMIDYELLYIPVGGGGSATST